MSEYLDWDGELEYFCPGVNKSWDIVDWSAYQTEYGRWQYSVIVDDKRGGFWSNMMDDRGYALRGAYRVRNKPTLIDWKKPLRVVAPDYASNDTVCFQGTFGDREFNNLVVVLGSEFQAPWTIWLDANGRSDGGSIQVRNVGVGK